MINDYGIKLVTAAAFAAVDEPGAEPLLGDDDTNVLPANGLALFWGSEGAGKTTLVLDLACHLATGTPWLTIDVPGPLRVLLIENEGPRGPFRRKIRAKLAHWPAAAERLLVLEQPWGEINFGDELIRSELALAITNTTDVVVVRPVTTLGMLGAGTPLEVREFEALIQALRANVPHPLAVVLVHHDNKAGQVSGAWGPVPDLLVHVTAQGHGKTRVFWQKARWASAVHQTTTHLNWADGDGYEIEEREEVTEDTIAEGILAAVDTIPGGSWTKIRAKVKGNAELAATVRDRLIATDALVNTAARDGQFNLWRPDDPAAGRSSLRTGLERLPFPAQEGASEPSRSPVPRSMRNGDGNGTGPDPEPTVDEHDEARWHAPINSEPELAGDQT